MVWVFSGKALPKAPLFEARICKALPRLLALPADHSLASTPHAAAHSVLLTLFATVLPAFNVLNASALLDQRFLTGPASFPC